MEMPAQTAIGKLGSVVIVYYFGVHTRRGKSLAAISTTGGRHESSDLSGDRARPCGHVGGASAGKKPARGQPCALSLLSRLASRALFLCTPVSKNGEELKDKTTHLVCYSVAAKNANKKVKIATQLGTQILKVGGSVTLCLPATKEVIK
jgi:hypothetical protein